jgi:23S rRNA (pseudouridine1915-N3)-methyltransferase
MLLRILAVGARMPAWVDQAVDDYTRRMPPEIRIEWRAVKAESRQAGGNARQWQEREAARIRDALPAGARLVILDERGDDVDSTALAARLARWQAGGTPVALVIGGPDGIDAGLKAAAHERLRLSSLTLAHPLVRVVLAEQLYRAWSINAGHPYHRD